MIAALMLSMMMQTGGSGPQANAVAAQFWDVCFTGGSPSITPDGLRAIATASAARSTPSAPGERPGQLSLSITTGGDKTTPVWRERLQDLALELYRAGTSPAFTDGVYTAYVDGPSPDCARLTPVTERTMRLWHLPWGIYFGPNDATITEGGFVSLRWWVVGYEPGRSRLRVRGHSDTVGSTEASQRMSERRAEAVADALVRLGVDRADIEVSAAGERELAKASADGVPEPINRRVTVDHRFPSPPR